MGSNLDIIGAIEAAYDGATDDDAWLGRLARAVAPAFGAGVAPTTAFFFDLRPGTSDLLGALASVGSAPYTREQFEKQQSVPSPEELRSAFECDMYTLLSRVAGKEKTAAGILRSGMVGGGTLDSLGLRANVSPDNGVVVTTLVPWDFRLRHRTLWVRLAAHIGAALRLRQGSGNPSPNAAAAILTPTGKLEHGTSETQAARVDLADAAKSMDRARGRLRRVDPDEASALWRAMVRGEWSLVDWFDHDGRRFLLAQNNRVAAKPTPQLTPREHQAVACAAMGHSNKLIAYDLGLSPGTVSVLLRRASTKLGVSTRPALIRAFRELATSDGASPAI